MDATQDVLQGKWHELKGQERLSGKMEELSGVLQQEYGHNKAKTDAEIDNWVKKAEKKLHAAV